MVENEKTAEDGKKGGVSRRASAREEKLAAELRDNLLKRKQQQRVRGARDRGGETVKD